MLPPQHIQLSLSQTIDPYLIDQLSHLSNQEKDELYQCTDYLQLLHSSSIYDKSISSSCMVTSADRRTMCNWSYDIVDACQIDREVAVIGMNYFDRYMSLSTTAATAASRRQHCSSTTCPRVPTTRKAFQLTYITCLIIALKCRGGLQVDSDFVSTTICQGIYQPSEIINMEIEILKVLGWKLNNGSVHDFINGMLELLPPPTTTTDGSVGEDDISREKLKAELKCSAVQIVERQMLDYTMVCNTSPSAMAYAALLVALSSSSSTLSSRNRRRERRLLDPQDRRRWLDNINIVLGIKRTDYNVQFIYNTMMMGCEDRSSSSCGNIVEISSSSPMSTTTPSSRYNSVPPTPTPSRCYTYCTPISSASSSPTIPPRMNCNGGVRVEEENDEGGKTTSKSRSSSLTSSEYADIVSLYTYEAEHLYLDMLSMTSGSGTDDDDDDDVGW